MLNRPVFDRRRHAAGRAVDPGCDGQAVRHRGLWQQHHPVRVVRWHRRGRRSAWHRELCPWVKPGTLTASATLLSIYIDQTNGNVALNTVTDPGNAVFLTATNGSILDGAKAGVINVTAADLWLSASVNIGCGQRSARNRNLGDRGGCRRQHLCEANQGALAIGGSFTTDTYGIMAGGVSIVTSSSPITSPRASTRSAISP